jgi:Uma2 family endonuclease
MEEVLIHPPRTIMEVFKMLPEGTLAEVIDNTLYMSPTPLTAHQRMVRELSFAFHQTIKAKDLGEIFFAPYDVFLDETSNAVQPDILFVSKRNQFIIQEQGTINGVPDMIVEVLSRGNQKHDKVVKKALYEKFGVREYWIVDPDSKQATGYTWKDGSYQLIAEETGKLNCILLGQTFFF